MLKITKEVMDSIAATVGSFMPETGGILGAHSDGVICAYYFDKSGSSTPKSYRPDVHAINELLSSVWMPNGTLMVGIVHSHSDGNAAPSCCDISYGIQILQALDTVDCFYIPIVSKLECGFSLNCYVLMTDSDERFVCRRVDYEVVD